ncbi:hypothetical protein DUNSADRAFT_16828 [Dunaliella salina]|uniref:Uncharacterized protein n=1 Tax=Dunaliella salina TaxID=3046 RepID=A0ABQ7G2U8_DUNSA|nr:hypothetical protein DUNSADRAFT_16828 [Dunaliella salina]|eukprot:KAF5828916.1 hypothetical protein DUNSADRAFT_16828 [Dunaliella salina]
MLQDLSGPSAQLGDGHGLPGEGQGLSGQGLPGGGQYPAGQALPGQRLGAPDSQQEPTSLISSGNDDLRQQSATEQQDTMDDVLGTTDLLFGPEPPQHCPAGTEQGSANFLSSAGPSQYCPAGTDQGLPDSDLDLDINADVNDMTMQGADEMLQHAPLPTEDPATAAAIAVAAFQEAFPTATGSVEQQQQQQQQQQPPQQQQQFMQLLQQPQAQSRQPPCQLPCHFPTLSASQQQQQFPTFSYQQQPQLEHHMYSQQLPRPLQQPSQQVQQQLLVPSFEPPPQLHLPREQLFQQALPAPPLENQLQFQTLHPASQQTQQAPQQQSSKKRKAATSAPQQTLVQEVEHLRRINAHLSAIEATARPRLHEKAMAELNTLLQGRMLDREELKRLAAEPVRALEVWQILHKLEAGQLELLLHNLRLDDEIRYPSRRRDNKRSTWDDSWYDVARLVRWIAAFAIQSEDRGFNTRDIRVAASFIQHLEARKQENGRARGQPYSFQTWKEEAGEFACRRLQNCGTLNHLAKTMLIQAWRESGPKKDNAEIGGPGKRMLEFKAMGLPV